MGTACWAHDRAPSRRVRGGHGQQRAGHPRNGAKLKPRAAEQARTDHFAFTIARYELAALADRVWQLRNNHTTYDACFLVLAEALTAPLYTCDHKLASDGHGARIRIFPRSH